jgi:hypothetical protein
VSTVLLSNVKAWLRVVHSANDALIQRLIDQAEDEALRFLGRTQVPTLPVDAPGECSSEQIPSSDDPPAASFEKAVCILVQAAYEEPEPDKAARMRQNAETVLMPYRIGLGV